MLGGYMGRLLFVDLSTGEIREEAPDARLYRDFMGGYGLGARILYSRQPGGVDPLGPENILGFTTGPLTGMRGMVMAPRFTVVGKSPLTGGWGMPTAADASARISSSPVTMPFSSAESLPNPSTSS